MYKLIEAYQRRLVFYLIALALAFSAMFYAVRYYPDNSLLREWLSLAMLGIGVVLGIFYGSCVTFSIVRKYDAIQGSTKNL